MSLEFFVGVFVLICTLWVVFDLLWGNPHGHSIRGLLKKEGKIGVWEYSFGGWNRRYHVVHTLRFLPCAGGYIVMYRKKFLSPIFFVPDYHTIKEIKDGE